MGNKTIRNRGYYRKQRIKHIKRKYRLKEITWGKKFTEDYYEDVPKGTLSKGKVHCSCGMCSVKTRNPLFGWKTSDKKKIEAMNQQLKEFEYLE